MESCQPQETTSCRLEFYYGKQTLKTFGPELQKATSSGKNKSQNVSLQTGRDRDHQVQAQCVPVREFKGQVTIEPNGDDGKM